ncbi:histidine acid phosphatase family protein [Stylonychia lemnae]|uniref:Histidine acid phosphatase family protein n=1 Tax=Stylonychia lemnae TaxID=5949 RepID=A0A078B9I3_STYLE|nr:histidine acid phosphatase family protein [Stylonychia lemnae]|eukprot:CDW91079.1 histidine acid phosphatase family protein [Stylonychia lemnae]
MINSKNVQTNMTQRVNNQGNSFNVNPNMNTTKNNVEMRQTISIMQAQGEKYKNTFLNHKFNKNNLQVVVSKKDEQKEEYLEAIEIFRQAAVKSFKNKYKKGSVDALNMVIRASLIIPDVYLLKSSLKMLGFLYIFFNKMKFAVSCFEKLRDVADEDQDFTYVMFAYKQLGLCFQKVQEYDRAIVCFKSLLQYAWKENNVEYEMQAYDYLGMQYYYLGQLDNAKYYHERMVRGKFESKKSNLRRLSEEQYKKKELAKEERYKKYEQTVEIDQNTGKEVIITREAKDYRLGREIREQSLIFMQRINDDLDMIIQNKGLVPMLLKKVSEPAKLYQTTQQDDQFQDMVQNNPQSLMIKAQQNIKQRMQNHALFSHPKIYIRQGTSIFEKTDKELPSPKDVNSKGKNVQLLPHFLNDEDTEDDVVQDISNDNNLKEENVRHNTAKQPQTARNLKAIRELKAQKIQIKRKRKIRMLTCLKPFRLSELNLNLIKIKFISKAWKRRMDTGPKQPFEFRMKDLFKKIELSKSEGPHYLLFLKHLSPIHNLKFAKEIEDKNYIKILKKFNEFKNDIFSQ